MLQLILKEVIDRALETYFFNVLKTTATRRQSYSIRYFIQGGTDGTLLGQSPIMVISAKTGHYPRVLRLQLSEIGGQ